MTDGVPVGAAEKGLLFRLLECVCLAAFAVQALSGAAIFTATSDETTHLPSGYTYVATGDLRLNPQHPPLVKMLAGLALVPLGPRLDLEDPGWTADPPEEWGFGRRFLYGNDADRLLFWGRVPVVGLGLILGLYVIAWARALFGAWAGGLAAVLFGTCPHLIAHGRLVTTDVGLAAFATAAFFHAWRFSRGRGAAHGVAAGVALGLALATKFSAVVLIPVAAVLVAATAPGPSGATRSIRVARGIVAAGALVALAALVVWAVYLFPPDPLFYVKGLARVNRDHDPTYADYLLGDFRVGGFWSYFPIAYAVKTPLPTLGLIALAAVLALRRREARTSWSDEAFLAAPALAHAAATCLLAANIGVRYLIPAHALALVFASRAAPWLARRPVGRAAGLAAAAWLVVGAARIHPDQLAYFNEAAGGPARGHEILDDSNVEWGQDLKRLRAWMDERGVESVRLLYPWNGSPEYYGIRYEPVTAQDWFVAPRPGLYVVSTMALVRGLHSARTEGVKTDWLERYRPVDRIAYSFFVYRFDEPGAPAGP